jgi:hypothetical protein
MESWVIPLLHAAIALLVGRVVPRLDRRFAPEWVATMSPSFAIRIPDTVRSPASMPPA